MRAAELLRRIKGRRPRGGGLRGAQPGMTRRGTTELGSGSARSRAEPKTGGAETPCDPRVGSHGAGSHPGSHENRGLPGRRRYEQRWYEGRYERKATSPRSKRTSSVALKDERLVRREVRTKSDLPEEHEDDGQAGGEARRDGYARAGTHPSTHGIAAHGAAERQPTEHQPGTGDHLGDHGNGRNRRRRMSGRHRRGLVADRHRASRAKWMGAGPDRQDRVRRRPF